MYTTSSVSCLIEESKSLTIKFTQVHGRELESYGAKQSQDEQNNTEKLERNRDEVLSYGVLSELNYEEILEDSDEVFHINIYK